MSREFKEPILAAIYRLAGIIIVVVGILAAVAAIMGSAFGGGPEGILGALVALVVTLIIALPFFGIAQLFTYIGKTAFYAESISDSLTMSMHEINKSTQQISERLKSMVMRDVSRDAGPAPERTADCPLCGTSIPIRQLRKGSNSCPQCKQVFEVE
ncbi:MAG: hypothetical protein U1E27_10710 [Kiritimatiellia bacterium]|nr:hypothetical protein [Kiritimatiellia bacterium]